MQPLSVLIVDDDKELRTSIAGILSQNGYLAELASTAEEALKLATQTTFDVILTDFRLPDLSGVELITRLAPQNFHPCIVLMTAFGDHSLAISALQAGAYDYLNKPFTGEELLLTIKKLEEREKLRKENITLKEQLHARYNFSNIIAKSESMKDVFTTVRQLASFSTTVLISGESGTGKELLAHAIHENSPRRGKPFVAVNCGAIPENLIESELFGHKKGAFTDASRDKKGLFEEADTGTLFLDEIGELSLHLQVKLLRALQEQKIRRVGDENLISIDVRVISATLRDLELDVKNKRFRDDLFYRLNVVSVHIPALRERPEDIPLLVDHFLTKHCKRLSLSKRRVSSEMMKILFEYPWRGNVRELENCLERAIVLSSGEDLEISALPEQVLNFKKISEVEPNRVSKELNDDNLSIKVHSKSLEIELIKRALAKTKGNRTHAAKILEISHRALLYKLKEYGL